VHILMMPEFNEATAESGTMQESPQSAGVRGNGGHSFSDLLDQSLDSMNGASQLWQSTLSSAAVSLMLTRQGIRHPSSGKLCLIFADTGNAVPPGMSEAPASFVPSALTTPMTHMVLSEILSMNMRNPRNPHIGCKVRMCLKDLAKRKLVPETLLTLNSSLLFIDTMCFIIHWALLSKVGHIYLYVWLLLPPLPQPLSFITGAAFIISGKPRLGRLFASLTSFGILNTVIISVLLLVFAEQSSWAFDTVFGLIVCAVKMALASVTRMHFAVIETVFDFSFFPSENQSAADETRSQIWESTSDIECADTSAQPHPVQPISSGNPSPTPF